MKEALICLIIALILGSLMNTFKGFDFWGTVDAIGSPAFTVPPVSESNFDSQVVNSAATVLVEFYNDDSDHCKAMTPVVVNVAKSLKGKVKVVRMDAVSSPTIDDLYGIKATEVPNFVLFKDGQRISNVVGDMTEPVLIDFVNRSLSKSAAPDTPSSQ